MHQNPNPELFSLSSHLTEPRTAMTEQIGGGFKDKASAHAIKLSRVMPNWLQRPLSNFIGMNSTLSPTLYPVLFIHPLLRALLCLNYLHSPFSFFFLVLSRWSLSMMRTCLSLARSRMKACLSRVSVLGRCRWFFTKQLSANDKKRFDLRKREKDNNC